MKIFGTVPQLCDEEIDIDISFDRRDLFAAFALAGMLASGEAIKNGTFAEMAFIYADSMEEARGK